MKKLSKSIQRVDWNVACFGLLKIQDPPHFQYPRNFYWQFSTSSYPKRDSSVSVTPQSLSRLDAKGPFPWFKAQNLVLEEHMAKWQNPLLWRKQELQKQKQKKVTPVPLSRPPERTRKSPERHDATSGKGHGPVLLPRKKETNLLTL